MTALSDLIARLEAEKGGSRELNHEIAVAIGWCFGGGRPKGGLWKSPDGKMNFDSVPDFTTSLDAALTLAPSDWFGDLEICTKPPITFKAILSPHSELHDSVESGVKFNGALALCIAALKAREAGR